MDMSRTWMGNGAFKTYSDKEAVIDIPQIKKSLSSVGYCDGAYQFKEEQIPRRTDPIPENSGIVMASVRQALTKAGKSDTKRKLSVLNYRINPKPDRKRPETGRKPEEERRDSSQ